MCFTYHRVETAVNIKEMVFLIKINDADQVSSPFTDLDTDAAHNDMS